MVSLNSFTSKRAPKVPVADPTRVRPANVAAPVALVNVNAVPNVPVPRVRLEAAGEVRDAEIGVVSVGDVESTFAPLPVEVVTPVPPEATAIGVEALTVVKAPVDGLEAPIAVFVMPTAE
jgi:hypothetical protein